jgi:ribonuclease BN (tRNA processing enzyme)
VAGLLLGLQDSGDGVARLFWRCDLPVVAGNELSGVVEAVGAGVARFTVGDRVLARVDHQKMGAFATYAVVAESLVGSVPESLDANLATPVDIYGPPPLTEMIEAFLTFARTDIDTRIADEGRPPLRPLIRPHELTGAGVIHTDDRVRITVATVDHPPMHAYAYRLDAADRSIVVSGDTRPCPALVELARGADILVHEALHLPSLDLPLSRTNGSRLREHLLGSHTCVADAGRIAAEANVGTLVLSHLVPGDAGIPDEVWIREAATEFDGPIIVGTDLQTL